MTWFVYIFQSEDGRAFYVGSGKEGRAEQHFRGQKASAALAAKFNEIGLTATLAIVSRHATVESARQAEGTLISELMPSGLLVNTHARPGIGTGKEIQKGEPIGVRLDAEEREALAHAAASDHRSLSALARKIIADWLRSNGWTRGEK